MLDLARLQAIRLRERPPMQVFMAHFFMRPQYRNVEIVFEGYENVPRDRRVYFAMNHTDRYNCWPMQYRMLREGDPCTATWVKGKYYENPLMAWFMDAANNIPLPSRGYVLTTELRRVAGRVPTDAEYRWLRSLLDGAPVRSEDATPQIASLARSVTGLAALEPQALRIALRDRFTRMMSEVVRINSDALHTNLNLVVFPEGTRSRRLGKGLTGLAQITQHLGAAIVPVGCSGTDRIYPGASPWARPGRVVYRFGAPLEVEGSELGSHRVRATFVPFTDEAVAAHGAAFEAITAVVMDRLDELLDPEYRRDESAEAGGSKGLKRFV